MRFTRQTLLAENSQLKQQLAAAKPESRQSLRRKVAETRRENEALSTQVKALKAKYEPTT